jgi:SAM-dependent methyltransferase
VGGLQTGAYVKQPDPRCPPTIAGRAEPREFPPMRNQAQWRSSKYVYREGRLTASRDPRQVGIGSRLIADLVAGYYDRNLRKHAQGRLLDLGCGNVPFYATYKEFVKDTTCVDWENTFHRNEYLDYELDLTKPLPFRDDEFDTIILSDVLEHIPVPEHLWKEMVRILSKKGKIVMNVPFYYWLHEEPHDYYRFTEFALRRYVEISGLKLIQLESIGGAPEVLADIFAKNILRLPALGRPLAAAAQWFTSVFIRTKFGRKVSEATRDNFPLGYFLIAEKPE